MARTTPNSDLVPKEALEQLKQLDTQLGSTTASLKAMLVPVQQISTELSNSAISYKDLVDVINRYRTVEGQAVQVTRQRKTAMDQLAALEKRLADAESKYGKAMAELREQLRQANRENQLAAQATLAHANSIEAMRVKLAQMKAEWATLDTSSDQFKKMTDDIAKLNAEILKNEQAIGVHGRNVGNYSSAFNGLQFSIQQVARELPSLTISAGQFFLAISNNLPILVDELHRAREANAALKKEGQATVPVWRQLLKGIVSWQTALVVGITLLTAYSDKIGEWILGLFAGEKAVTNFREAQEKLYESMKEEDTGIGKQLATLRKLKNGWNDLGDSLKDKKQFITDNKDEFDELGVSIETVDDAENLLVRNTEAFTKSIRLRAEATAAFKLASEQYEESVRKMMDAESASAKGASVGDMLRSAFATAGLGASGQYVGREDAVTAESYRQRRIDGLKDESKAARQTAETYLDLYDKLNEEARKLMENAGIRQKVEEESSNAVVDFINKEREARLQYYEQVYKDYSERNKAIVEDDKLSYEQRLNALDKFTEAQITAINMSKQAQLDALPEDEDTTFQRLIIERKAQEEINKVLEERRSIQGSLLIQSQQMGLSRNIESITKEEREAQNLLKDLYLGGDIDKEEYENRRLQTTRDYATRRFNAELEGLNEILNMEELTQEQRAKIEEEYGKAEREYQKWLLDQENADYDKAMKEKEEMDKLYAQKKQELLQGVFNFATALLERDLENQLEQLDRESEENEKWAEGEAARIDRLEESGAISKEQADARKAAIDDQAQARETQIEEKRKELQRKQAQYQKAESLMSIAFSTAKAIMAAWTNPWAAPALIPTIIAAGAAQMAAVVATPIPEYAEGTDDHPGGLAVVGDGGRSEMVIAGGRIYKTPAVDTLVDLPRHAVVLPDFGAAAERLPEMPQVNSVVNVDNSKLEALSKENGKLLRQLIRRMEINAKNEIYARELERLRPTKRRSR